MGQRYYQHYERSRHNRKIEIIVYTITYHDNLEDVEAELPTEPVTYTIHDRYVLPDAYLEGYLFLGWYDNPECEGLAITETSHGDLELYAYFIKIPGEGETIGDGSVELVATEQVVQVNRSTQVYAKMVMSISNHKTFII